MTIKESEKSFQWTNVWNQYFATIAANILILSQGSVNGWPSPALPILSSEKSPLLSGPLTNEEVSWIGSINCIGGLSGCLLFIFVIPVLGSKRALLILTIPSVTYWAMIYFGSNYYHILIARFLSGCNGGAMQSATILYVSEIANDDIRGRLGSMSLFMRNIGVLFIYVAGSIVDYKYIPCICVLFPIIFFLVFIMLPNTPQYLMQHGKIQKAENALKYYKGYKESSKEEDMAIYKEFERLKSISTERKTGEKLQASDLFNRTALKGLGIGIALTSISVLTANFTIISYAVMIFDRSGAPLDPYVSSIMLAIALILGSLLTTSLADTLGRKVLNLASLIGSAVGLFAISFYYYLHINGYDLSAFAWVPVASLSFVIFASSAGIVPLSFVCSVEYLPSKIRNVGMAIIGGTISMSGFLSVKLYPPLLEIVDLHGYMLIFGVGSVLGAIFVFYVVDETNGTCLDDVGADEKEKIEYARTARINSLT